MSIDNSSNFIQVLNFLSFGFVTQILHYYIMFFYFKKIILYYLGVVCFPTKNSIFFFGYNANEKKWNKERTKEQATL